ncbi:MAG: conjugal transfer protein TraF [Thermodesulfobacteriota bacterium]|nr:conjugal transfer protein TraF [Thermodesulfobacteriota bacterium]
MLMQYRQVYKTVSGIFIFVIMGLIALPAAAMDTFFVGARAMGMGGANVAAVDDTSAQYYNPAAFGFLGLQNPDGSRMPEDNNNLGRKDWGVDLDGAVGYRLENNFGRYADTLADINLDGLSNGIDTPAEARELVSLAGSLEGISSPDTAVNADVSLGAAGRSGHFAFGMRGFAQAHGRVYELDLTNLGLDVSRAELVNGLDTVVLPGFDSTGYTYRVFTPQQRQQLATAYGVGANNEIIQKLDYMTSQESANPEDVAGTVALLAAMGNAAGEGTLEDNRTSVLLSGFSVSEAVLSYGRALNSRWSLGGNVKLMQGRVYGNRVVVFDDDADEVLSETDARYEESLNFGIDLGVMARFRKFNVGIMGRNLNSPKFDGLYDQILLSNGQVVPVSVSDVKLDPQVTAGVAFIPFTTLTLAADLDLTENDAIFSSYQTQNLHLGLEWDAFRFLALRLGTYKNLSESDIGWVYTAGLGVNLWAARLDISGAMADETETFDEDEIPIESRLAFKFSVDF